MLYVCKGKFLMPLTNNVIIRLNEITTLVEDKNNLQESEIESIKEVFRSILDNGHDYNVEEIESWFENEGSWKSKEIRTRLTNLSHYIQSKYEQTAKFRIISNDEESCGCDEH